MRDRDHSVVENITKHKKIIITADHGLTRLAVRANELQLIKTLDYDCCNWRYRDATGDDRQRPDNVDIEYNQQNGKYYWTIRNYDRFIKSGWVKYEIHGGSSIEEVMVPFIVVVNGTAKVVESNDKGTERSVEPTSQIKEDSSLDELFG